MLKGLAITRGRTTTTTTADEQLGDELEPVPDIVRLLKAQLHQSRKENREKDAIISSLTSQLIALQPQQQQQQQPHENVVLEEARDPFLVIHYDSSRQQEYSKMGIKKTLERVTISNKKEIDDTLIREQFPSKHQQQEERDHDADASSETLVMTFCQCLSEEGDEVNRTSFSNDENHTTAPTAPIAGAEEQVTAAAQEYSAGAHDDTIPIGGDNSNSKYETKHAQQQHAEDAAAARHHVRDVVDKIQQWLFLEGGNLRDVPSLITEYCLFCRDVIGIPLDRIFIAGMMLHKTMSAYVWKWEVDEEFEQHEVPRHLFEKPNYNPNEPFAVLMEGKAMSYRMSAQDDDDNIPPGCSWFRRDGYQDYLALPIYHQGEFKGAMAWCSKSATGFSNHHVAVFTESLAALSTVLRLHTNDLVMTTVTTQLEREVAARTKDLATANQDLATANHQLKQQSQAQLRHFSMMAHEIRTPLNCVIAMSTLLLDSSLDPQVDESIRMIATSSDLLLAVIDDVLDYSKLAAGKMDITMQTIDLQLIVDTVLSSIRIKANTIGLTLRLDFDSTAVLPQKICTDGRRLQQVLYNLLGNAIKFGEAGEFVDFTIQQDKQEATMMQFIVKDYGPGIAQDQFDKIFKPFQQAKTTQSKFGGTGLGLAITWKIVNALGGHIAISSQEGEWTEFRFSIPMNEAASPPRPYRGSFSMQLGDSGHRSLSLLSLQDSYSEKLGLSQTLPSVKQDDDVNTVASESMKSNSSSFSTENSTAPPHPRSIEDLTVLVAEDNIVNQKVLDRILKRVGLQNVQLVTNGLEAVEACQTTNFDVILMDFDMPVMNGIDATIAIKKNASSSSCVPLIIFLTAHALQEYRDRAKEAGGDGFMSKPFKMDQMRDLFEQYVSNSRMEDFV